MKTSLAVIDAYLSGETSLYYSDHGFRSGSADSPAHTHFVPRIKRAATVRRQMFTNWQTFGRSSIGTGVLELENNAAVWGGVGALDALLDYAFDGRAYQQYFGETTGAFPSGVTQVIEAVSKNLEVSRTRVALKLRDKMTDLDVPIQTNRYLGTGALEGGEDLQCKPKPFCLGDCFNVPALLVDPVKLIYQVADGALNSIPAVRDRGLLLTQTPQAWSALDNDSDTTDFRAVACKGTDTIIGVGAPGVLRRSDDAGASFSTPTSPFSMASAGPAPSLLASGTVDGEVNGVSKTRVSSIVISGGANRILVVSVAMRRVASDDEEVGDIVSDLDGDFVKLTAHEDTGSGHARAELWYLLNPSEGTHTITATLLSNKTARFIIASHCYQDVDQTTPFGTAVTADAEDTGPATVDVTSDATDLVIDVVARKSSSQNIIVGGGQTELVIGESTNSTADNNIQLGVSTEGGAATTTMSWTWAAGTRIWATIAVSLHNVAAAVPTVTGIAYDETLNAWVAVCSDGQMAQSTDDGENWYLIVSTDNPYESGTEAINDIAASGLGTFITVGQAGTVARSTDALTFGAASITSTGALASVIYGTVRCRWVLVTVTDSVIETSDDDGVTWTQRESTQVGVLTPKALSFGVGVYVLMQASGGQTTLSSSVDGVNFTERYTSLALGGADMAFGGAMQQFIVAGSHSQANAGRVLTSADGIRWFVRTSVMIGANTSTSIGVGASASLMVVAGENGQLEEPQGNETYASEADLLDDDKQPEPGTYKAWLTGGQFRLGSIPDGKITADVVQGANAAARTPGQLFVGVFEKLGKSGLYNATDVTDLDALDNGVCGIWVGAVERKANSVLDEIVSTPGAWWGADRLGEFRVGQLVDPSGESASYNLVATDIIKDSFNRRESNDPGRGVPHHRTAIQWKKNYAVQSDGLSPVVTPANRLLYEEKWREVEYVDTTVTTVHPDSLEQVYPSLYQVEADAQGEATRREALRGVKRDVFELSLDITENFLGIDIGTIVNITQPRFGFSAGKNAVVIMAEADPSAKRINLGVWL